ncbi:hypothetical protein ACQ4PT_015279 [Festuca glaucescens]
MSPVDRNGTSDLLIDHGPLATETAPSLVSAVHAKIQRRRSLPARFRILEVEGTQTSNRRTHPPPIPPQPNPSSQPTMAAASEKTAEDIRRELQELQRQHREISERLRDPRGLRRGAPPTGPGGPRPLRGFQRPAPEPVDQPEPKRRLLSAVVKVDSAEAKEEDANNAAAEGRENGSVAAEGAERRGAGNGGFRRDGTQWVSRRELDKALPEPLPRQFPKDDDQSLVRRNRRMLGKLLVGTLEKFQQEDKKLSNSEAFMRRSEAQQKADQKAREDSERLRQQEQEQAAEKRRRDMTLRARVAAKAEEKRLELLYLQWTEHHKKLSNFLRLFLFLVQKYPY